MKKLISLLCLTIMLLSATAFTTQKTNANAVTNGTYYTLHNTYDWWKFVPPSTNTYGTQISDKIYWGDVDLAKIYMYPSSHSGNGTLHSNSM